MPHLALSAIGRDRPGIVAGVAEVLLRHGANVEDSQMAILRGHFTMVLVVAAPDELDEQRLRADLAEVEQRLGLEALSLAAVAELEHGPAPSHVVTVYGADHPGILHAVSAAMAERMVDITDLSTRLLAADGPHPVYALLMEVALPPELAPDELERALEEVGREQGVDVSVRPLESEAL